MAATMSQNQGMSIGIMVDNPTVLDDARSVTRKKEREKKYQFQVEFEIRLTGG